MKKASALIFALIILSTMLFIGLSVSITTVKEQKSAMESEKSSIAYQIAESGVESVMEELLSSVVSDPNSELSSIGCSDGKISDDISGGSYEISFYYIDDSGAEQLIEDCGDYLASEVAGIKSSGTFQNDVRTIHAPVIFPVVP